MRKLFISYMMSVVLKVSFAGSYIDSLSDYTQRDRPFVRHVTENGQMYEPSHC